VVWRQGAPTGFPNGLWKVVPPPYKEMFTLRSAPQGTYKFASGKGSSYKTIQILGGSPEKDVDLNLGWVNIHITAKNGQVDIDYTTNSKANVGKREETIGMGEGQIPYEGVEEDRLKARLTKEEKTELEQNPELTVEDFYDERPEDVPEHEKQRIPRERVSDNYIPDGLDKVELPQYRYGKIKVYLVNGDYIRTRYANESIGDRLGNDWAGGGHYFVFWKIIPRNEIWVDRTLVGLDRKGFILHEMTERRIMENGKEYSDAHNEDANPPEIVARMNPNLVDKLLQDEMNRYEIPEPKIRRRYSEDKIERPKTVAEIEREYAKYDISKKTKRDEEEIGDDEIAPKYYLGRRILPKVEADSI